MILLHLKKESVKKVNNLCRTTEEFFHFTVLQSGFIHNKCKWSGRWLGLGLVSLTQCDSVERGCLKQDLWLSGETTGWNYAMMGKYGNFLPQGRWLLPHLQIWGQCSRGGPGSIQASRAWTALKHQEKGGGGHSWETPGHMCHPDLFSLEVCACLDLRFSMLLQLVWPQTITHCCSSTWASAPLQGRSGKHKRWLQCGSGGSSRA